MTSDTSDQQTSTSSSTAHFVTLTRSRCEALLRQHSVGRVGFCGSSGPLVLPVNYALYNDSVVFRTSPHGVLSELGRRTAVAFEVDEIDETGQTGWNLLGLGFTRAVTQNYPLTQLWREGPVPWASGTRTLFVAITFDSLTGRQVRGPFVD